MTSRIGVVRALTSALALFAAFATSLAQADALQPKPAFKKVLLVVLENTDYADAIQQSDLARLADEGALLANFRAETHPSQPNYIAMTSGDTHGVRDNEAYNLDVRHIGDLFEAKGLSWKIYAEGYPGNCFKGEQRKDYVRKHNPFISYANVQSDPGRCARIVPAEVLDRDLASGKLPYFSFYVPDLRNDGHDTNLNFAGRWVARKFVPKLRPEFAKGLLLVITFDEARNASGDNRIYTALLGAGVKPGSRSDALYDHYSLLRTLEERFGLGSLGKNDEKAVPIQGTWK